VDREQGHLHTARLVSVIMHVHGHGSTGEECFS
jgi:hypothetical protein